MCSPRPQQRRADGQVLWQRKPWPSQESSGRRSDTLYFGIGTESEGISQKLGGGRIKKNRFGVYLGIPYWEIVDCRRLQSVCFWSL